MTTTATMTPGHIVWGEDHGPSGHEQQHGWIATRYEDDDDGDDGPIDTTWFATRAELDEWLVDQGLGGWLSSEERNR